MEVSVVEKSENPGLERDEIKFEVEHRNSPTPSRAEVLEELSSVLGVSKELIVIEKLATLHGRQVASGTGRIYESEERLQEFEPGYLINRTKASGEKVEETEEMPEEEPEETEEQPEEESQAEEQPEEMEEDSEEEGEKEE